MYFIICVLFLTRLCLAELNSECTTPNGETAKCIPIQDCMVIKLAISYLNPESIAFAKKSQCGYDNGPLVCCGTTGKYFSTSTSAPEIEITAIAPQEEFTDPLNDSSLPDNTLCGVQYSELNSRIVGGNISDIYEFPWMVALKYQKKEDGSDGGVRCSGTLISNIYVLTAAQCLKIMGYDLVEARLGEWRLSTTKDCVDIGLKETVCADDVVDLKIIKTIQHPYFSLRSGNNDIALLTLEKKVKFTDQYVFRHLVCQYPEEGTLMDISGWGVTDDGRLSDYKLKVKIPMVSNEHCTKVYTEYSHINPNQACAGGVGGKDACHGDSGGPLMTTFKKKYDTDEEQWYQEGIIYRDTNERKRLLDIGYAPGNGTCDILLPLFKGSVEKAIDIDTSKSMIDFTNAAYASDILSFKILNFEDCVPEEHVHSFDYVFSFWTLDYKLKVALKLFIYIKHRFIFRKLFSNIFKVMKLKGTTFVAFVASSKQYDIYQNIWRKVKYSSYIKDFDVGQSVFHKCGNCKQQLVKILKNVEFEVQLCEIENISILSDRKTMSEFLLSISPVCDHIPKQLINEFIDDRIIEFDSAILIRITNDN
ncbi:hypothetical protein FQA39_LY01676 [Lamprigera yunnana]|nr:hypothetical protein FQA39_LY01676 [Lamprigera yunnana]